MRILGLLCLLGSISAFSADMPWKNDINHYGWLGAESCTSKLSYHATKGVNHPLVQDLQKAVDVINEVLEAESSEKLEQFISELDLSKDVSLSSVAVEVFKVHKNEDLCYDGDLYGYDILKHIVKSNLDS